MNRSENADLEQMLRSANSLVDTMLPRARRLLEKVSSLRKDGSDEPPPFDGDFSQEGLLRHLDRLEEWTRAPWRARSRKILESKGVKCDGLSSDLLDDWDGTEKTAAAIEQLRRTENPAAVLATSDILLSWLREGHSDAQKRLSALDRAREGFCRLAKCRIPQELSSELIRRAVLNTDCLMAMEKIASEAETLKELEFDIASDSSWDETISAVEAVYDSIMKLVHLLGTNASSAAAEVEKKSLLEAKNVLQKKVELCESERARLRDEWLSLSSAATALSIPMTTTSPPERIPELRKEVKALLDSCLGRLGESGMQLLGFLREQSEYPRDMTSKQIEEALLAVRPMISQALKGKKSHA